MDDQLRGRIREMAARLAEDEKQKLCAAGTFVDLERLTVEIGDELTRQLTSSVLASRAQEAARQPLHACPECRKECSVEELDPILLKGMRGEVEYSEPKCFCSSCRRSFFPGGQGLAASRA